MNPLLAVINQHCEFLNALSQVSTMTPEERHCRLEASYTAIAKTIQESAAIGTVPPFFALSLSLFGWQHMFYLDLAMSS